MTIQCTKCGGSGVISGFEHIADGVCFRCEGTGMRLTKEERIGEFRKRDAAQKDRHDTRLAKSCGMTLAEFRAISYKGC